MGGVYGKNVVWAGEVELGRVKIGERVLVAGGGAVGCEVANFLAERGKNVTIVEMLDTVGLDMDSWIWACLSAELVKRSVKILKSTKIEEVTNEGVMLVDRTWNRTYLKADTVVLALGLKASNALAGELAGRVREVYTIGDAKLPRRVQEAIFDGFRTAYQL